MLANFSITDVNFPNVLRNRLLNDATSLLYLYKKQIMEIYHFR